MARQVHGLHRHRLAVREPQALEENHPVARFELERGDDVRRRADHLELEDAGAGLHAVLANVLREADQREDRLAQLRLRDERAAAVAANQAALADELRERLTHRDAADLELLAEPPLGGHLRIGRPLAGVEQVLNGRLELVIQRDRARLLKGRHGIGGCGGGPGRSRLRLDPDAHVMSPSPSELMKSRHGCAERGCPIPFCLDKQQTWDVGSRRLGANSRHSIRFCAASGHNRSSLK